MFSIRVVSRNRSSSRPARSRHQGLRWVALAVALALGSIPLGAEAKASAETSTQVVPTQPGTLAPISTEGRSAQAQNYASREASAKGLEKFEGGSTTIWIGGSAVVVVLLVVLIVVLI
jgi:hypothetical protein